MGQFPIYTTQRSLPGTSGGVTANLNPRTGGEQVGEALGDLGQEVTRFAIERYRAQGEVELAEINAQDKAAFQNLLLNYQKNNDPTTYDQEYRQLLSEVETREIKNGWARQRRNLVLPELKTRWEGIVDQAKYEREVDNHKQAISRSEAAAIVNGNTVALIPLYDTAIRLGYMTQDGKEERLADVKYRASQQRIAAEAGNEPEKFLKENPNPEMFRQHYPDSKSTDWQWARGMAQAASADRLRAQDALTHAQLEGIYGSARTQGIESVRIKISQSDGLTEAQKVQAMKVAVTASELWGKTGSNPWEHTTNYASLAQTRIDVRTKNGPIKTLDDINRRMFEGNMPNWSFDDWQSVTSLFETLNKPSRDPSAYSPSHPLAKMYFDGLMMAYMGKDGKIPTENQQSFVTQYKSLEKSLSDPKVWNNPAEMRKAYDNAMQPLREQKAEQYLYNWVRRATFFAPLGWAMRRPFAPTPLLPRPTTIEEYNALPSGADYIDPNDGLTYTKE